MLTRAILLCAFLALAAGARVRSDLVSRLRFDGAACIERDGGLVPRVQTEGAPLQAATCYVRSGPPGWDCDLEGAEPDVRCAVDCPDVGEGWIWPAACRLRCTGGTGAPLVCERPPPPAPPAPCTQCTECASEKRFQNWLMLMMLLK